MGSRLALQRLLESAPGVEAVYFQPPNNLTMRYPCIVYSRSQADTIFADNNPYRHVKRYTVTLIARDPDSHIYDFLAALPLCRFDRHFTNDGLNHDSFSLYY